MQASQQRKNNDWLVVIAEGEEIKLESTALCDYFGLFLSSRASGVVYHSDQNKSGVSAALLLQSERPHRKRSVYWLQRGIKGGRILKCVFGRIRVTHRVG